MFIRWQDQLYRWWCVTCLNGLISDTLVVKCVSFRHVSCYLCWLLNVSVSDMSVVKCIGFRYVGCCFNSILRWMPLHSSADILTSSKWSLALQSWALNTLLGWLNSTCLCIRLVINKMLRCKNCLSAIGWMSGRVFMLWNILSQNFFHILLLSK